MKKPILILIAVGIFVALITSGLCSGPIDLVFNGWRESTGCESSIFNRFSHFIVVDQRESGVIAMGLLLILLLAFIGFIFGLIKAFSWLKNR